MSTPIARTTDPETSHEAAALVDRTASQDAVYQVLSTLHAPVTDADLAATYDTYREALGLPRLSPSRIRTARHELTTMRLVEHAGWERPAHAARRCRTWQTVKE